MNKFQQLSELCAGEFSHIDGTLIDHLKGTRQLLRDWGASSALQDAGLYHAAYSTAGFDQNLVSIEYRAHIQKIVGEEAESIIYQYCACDRELYFSNLGTDKPVFRNRFTGESYHLGRTMLGMFCELTAANETEIAIANSKFKAEHGLALKRLFRKMAPYLSAQALDRTVLEFGARNTQLG